MNDTDVLPVIGELRLPASWSGVTFPSCPHVAPWSCPRCDGSRSTDDGARGAVPPCMRKEPLA